MNKSLKSNKRFLVGNFLSAYRPMAKPPERNLESFALQPDELSERLQARTKRRVSRTKGYNRFRAVGAVVVMVLFGLGLYADLSSSSVEEVESTAHYPEVTVPSFQAMPAVGTDVQALLP